MADKIFGEARWQFILENGAANFYADPGRAKICATHSGLASLWCVSFVAFHVTNTAAVQRRITDRSASYFDIGASYSALRLDDYLYFARSLFRSDKEWPESLQLPNAGAPLDSEDGRVNNIFFGALAWILLHEIAHVHLKHEVLIPIDQRVRQEFDADDFATRWVLKEAGQGLAREFRTLMVCVALAWLFLNEDTIGVGVDHPPAFARFRDAIAHFDVGARSVALENAFYLFKAVFAPALEPPAFDTSKEAFEWIRDRLDELFSR